MREGKAKLLCIDLQVDASLGLQPSASALFGARQLVGGARRKGWAIAHMRRRRSACEIAPPAPQPSILRTLDDLRPLPSEPVLLRDQRSLACVATLADFLEGWRGEAVYVAAFDRMALLSCLLACHGQGPHFVLVDEAIATASPKDGRAAGDGFAGAVRDLAGGVTTLSSAFVTPPAPGAVPPTFNTHPPAAA